MPRRIASLKSFAPDLFREGPVTGDLIVAGTVQPAEPAVFVGVGP